MLHYRVFRPFIERQHETGATTPDVDSIAEHIARFSLRALGYDEPFIERALTEAAASAPAVLSQGSTS